MVLGLTRKKWKIIPNWPYASTDILVCVFCALSKVVSRYDLSVLSMSVTGVKKSLDREVGGWGVLY